MAPKKKRKPPSLAALTSVKCLTFARNMGRNPLTGRKLAHDGRTARRIRKACAQQHPRNKQGVLCALWNTDRNVNPLTGRGIARSARLYRRYTARCAADRPAPAQRRKAPAKRKPSVARKPAPRKPAPSRPPASVRKQQSQSTVATLKRKQALSQAMAERRLLKEREEEQRARRLSLERKARVLQEDRERQKMMHVLKEEEFERKLNQGKEEQHFFKQREARIAEAVAHVPLLNWNSKDNPFKVSSLVDSEGTREILVNKKTGDLKFAMVIDWPDRSVDPLRGAKIEAAMLKELHLNCKEMFACFNSLYDDRGRLLRLVTSYHEGKVDGNSLASIIGQTGPTKKNAQFVNKMVNSAFAALWVLHVHQMSHFDLKPQNLLLDKTGQVSIIDFEAASWGEHHHVNMSSQSPGWAGPEFEGYFSPIEKDQDLFESAPRRQLSLAQRQASDAFALAMTLYQMVKAILNTSHKKPPANVLEPSRDNNVKELEDVAEENQALVAHWRTFRPKSSDPLIKWIREASQVDLSAFLQADPRSRPTALVQARAVPGLPPGWN